MFNLRARRALQAQPDANKIETAPRNLIPIFRGRWKVLSLPLVIATSAVMFTLSPPALSEWQPQGEWRSHLPDAWFPIPGGFPASLWRHDMNNTLGWCETHMSIPPGDAQTAYKKMFFQNSLYEYCRDFALRVLNGVGAPPAPRGGVDDSRWHYCVDNKLYEGHDLGDYCISGPGPAGGKGSIRPSTDRPCEGGSEIEAAASNLVAALMKCEINKSARLVFCPRKR